MHRLWLHLSRERYGGKLHHRDIIGVALKRLQRDLETGKPDVMGDFEHEVDTPSRKKEMERSPVK